MGMGGMTTDAYAKYASATDGKKAEVANAAKSSSYMTVAELRNFVNPMTTYYDKLSAKAFIEDVAISNRDKVMAVFGRNVKAFQENELIDMMRKAVS